MIRKHRHLAKAYEDYVQMQPLHDDSRKRKLRIVRRYFEFIEEHDDTIDAVTIKNDTVYAFLSTWRHLKANSYNLYLGELRYFFKWLQRYQGARPLALLLESKAVEERLPRNISMQHMIMLCTPEQDIMTAATSPSDLLRRLCNQAIIEFLFSTGVRSLELRQIRFKHLSHDLRECSILSAKRGKNRIVYLGKPAREALLAYMSIRSIDRRRNANAYVFPGRNGAMMTGKNLIGIVKKLAIQRIGYPITPHQIRHTFGTEMLRASRCIRSVQDMLGHACISNTARYCHLDYSDQLAAMGKHHPHGRSNTSRDGENT